jgi:drug/metabolite transporter (DMT)-like permease
MPHTESRRTAFFYITLIPLIWGTTFAVTKGALTDISPVLFAFIRFILTILIFFSIFKISRKAALIIARPKTQQERDLRTDSLVLGSLLGFGYVLQFIGLQTSTTTDSAFITSTAAIWTPLFAYFVIKEEISKQTIIALLIATVGLVLLTEPYKMEGVVVGDILTLVSAISFGLYIAWIDRALPRTAAYYGNNRDAGLVISSNQLLVATITIGISLLLIETPRIEVTKNLTFAVLYNGILATALTTYLQNRYQQTVSATVAALIFMLEPVVAAIVGALFVHEHLETVELLGALLIIVGVIVAQIRLPSRTRN